MCLDVCVCKNLVWDASILERRRDRPYPDCAHYAACRGTKFFEPLPESIRREEMEIRRLAISNFGEYLKRVRLS